MINALTVHTNPTIVNVNSTFSLVVIISTVEDLATSSVLFQ
jgi:hypothetical protein